MLRLKLNSELGMTMLIAVMVTFLGTILAGSYLSMVNYESRNSVWQKHRAQSLFLAEAGIEKGLYYLNSPENQPSDWMLDMDGQLVTPLYASGNLAGGTYDITLYDQSQASWLPANSYLIASTGTIPRMSEEDIVHKLSCVASKLDEIPIAAALSILDDADPEIELNQFASVEWTVDGTDMDNTLGTGLPGIAIANNALSSPDNIEGDDILAQLGANVDQVTGADEFANSFAGASAILEDPDLPKNLDAYANYFQRIAIDISNCGNIPSEALGSYEEPQVLYADLSKGPVRLLPNQPGYGVLVLDGIGDFTFDVSMEGRAEWYGVVICARDSKINLYGGGNSPSHIYGALLVANGEVTMNGTADIVYSSDNVNNVNLNLLLYQVYSWCGGWGETLDMQLYTSM